MTIDDAAAVKRLLSRLPAGDTDPARAARVRARCHAMLARSQMKPASVPAPRSGRFLVELTIAGGFSLIYLSSVVFNALQAGGLGLAP